VKNAERSNRLLDSRAVDRQDYLRRADECLERVADWLEAFDPDELDYATADGVVTLSFRDGTRYVLNRQSAASQMWFAAGARAYHYSWDEAKRAWVDDRDGHLLEERLADSISTKLGRKVQLA
jgi:CyaY protein